MPSPTPCACEGRRVLNRLLALVIRIFLSLSKYRVPEGQAKSFLRRVVTFHSALSVSEGGVPSRERRLNTRSSRVGKITTPSRRPGTSAATQEWSIQDTQLCCRLEAPILYQPDTDFQSLDGLYLEPDSWLEIPLRSDRPIPFKCAVCTTINLGCDLCLIPLQVTLPDPPTLPRSGYVPFFVVFTTRPRSSILAREIAADATIAVSLLRQITVLSGPSPLYSPTASAASVTTAEDSDARSTSSKRSILRRRAAKSSPSTPSGSPRSLQQPVPQDKPLPPIPHGISDMRSLHTDVCIGFPKRPRNRVAAHQRHPSIEEHAALPDGLYKGKLRLDKTMLPSIEWAGLTVKVS